jgi:hypothetical protein
MELLKLLLSFAPWLAFLAIAQGSLFRLKLGLVVGLVLCVVMGVARLHRGMILWIGLVFFTSATVAVAGFDNIWTASHMGVLANSALAAAAWIGIVREKPFTLDYAREHVDPTLWNDPRFIRSAMLVASVWGAAFTANAVLAYGKMRGFLLPETAYEIVSYALLLGTAGFTTWYPKRQRRLRRERAARG